MSAMLELQRMAAAPAALHSERCLRRRHSGAACHFCAEACPTGAIQLQERGPALAAERCIQCGACLSVCPTECFTSDKWSERSLIQAHQLNPRPQVEVLCKRHPTPQLGVNAVNALQVDVCLAAITPGLWFELGLAADVRVRVDACADCPLHQETAYIQRAVEQAQHWLTACGSAAKKLTLQTTPPGQQAGVRRTVVSAEHPVMNRRDFFFFFARSSGSADQALTGLPTPPPTVDDPDETAADAKNAPYLPAWLRRLAGVFRQARQQNAARQTSLPTDSPAVAPGGSAGGGAEGSAGGGAEGGAKSSAGGGAERGAKSGAEITGDLPPTATHWPTLAVSDQCVACGACSRYCPSGALRTQRKNEQFRHLFTPGFCIACGICAQACNSHALTRGYSPEDAPFEERVMSQRAVGVCRKCGGPALRSANGLCYWCAKEPSPALMFDSVRKALNFHSKN